MKKGQQRYVIFGILKCNTHIKESIHEIRQAKKNFEKGGTQAKAQFGYAWVPFRQLSWIWLEGIVFPNESLLLRSTTGGSVLHNWPYIEKLTWRFKNALGLWMSSSQICVKYCKKKIKKDFLKQAKYFQYI